MRTPQSHTARENPPSQSTLEERMPVQAKLAAAWTSFMFLYIYVDYLHLYKPGAIRDILDGVVFKFDINQAFPPDTDDPNVLSTSGVGSIDQSWSASRIFATSVAGGHGFCR